MEITLFEVEGKEIKSERKVPVQNNGPTDILGALKDAGTEVLICDFVGERALPYLQQMQIKLVTGIQGDAKTALQSYLDGHLTSIPVQMQDIPYGLGQGFGYGCRGRGNGMYGPGRSCRQGQGRSHGRGFGAGNRGFSAGGGRRRRDGSCRYC
jgi:predicted Fe-Mo cluster-binding NifX family protein